MFFVLSKLFWILAQPSHWLGFLVLATVIALVLRWNRAARFFAVAAALLLVAAAFLMLLSTAVQIASINDSQWSCPAFMFAKAFAEQLVIPQAYGFELAAPG